MGLDLGAFQLTGDPPAADGVAEICVPRRTVLDKILVDAAAEAGAEVREGFSVTGLTFSDSQVTGISGHRRGGAEIQEHARSANCHWRGWAEFAGGQGGGEQKI
jgi:hypothetical protein